MVFGRLITAMFTPFTRNNEIDWPRLEECIERLIATGSDGIVVSGTTAESPNLSHDEKLQLFRFTVDKVAGRAKVIAGTGSNNTAQSIQLTKQAEEIGVDGIMLVAPYYNKPSQQGLIRHFTAIAESTQLPVMLYNIPGRTGINMDVETMVRLTEIDSIVAIKEASGDLGQISEVIARVGDDIAVYSGDDKLTLPVLAVGGAGVVSVASHVAGREMKEMIDAFFAGDNSKALALHKKLLPVFNGLFMTTSPVPLKYAMSQKGWCDPYVRLPLVELDEKQKAEADDWVRLLG